MRGVGTQHPSHAQCPRVRRIAQGAVRVQPDMCADARVMSLKRQLGPVEIAVSRDLNVYYRRPTIEDGPAQGQFFCKSRTVKRISLLGQFGRVV